MKVALTVALLVCSNTLMALAWYGHLRLAQSARFAHMSLPLVILLSWGIAFFEYCLAVPANRIGYAGTGGPFNLWQLKIIQEVLSLTVFTVFTMLVFKGEGLRMNHAIGFGFMVLAVYFIFKE